MSGLRQRILMIGSHSALSEGVFDLLQLVGYEVALREDWPGVERALRSTQPDLAVVEAPCSPADLHELCGRIRALPGAEQLRILVITASGDEEAEDQRSSASGQPIVRVHALHSARGVLETVRACLSESRWV